MLNKNQINSTAQGRLNLLKLITEALSLAHDYIVHRDLKPSNIFLKGGSIDEPVIMDFGISILGSTGNSEICGTPKYMSPEQFLTPEDVDLRTDLFSLGVIFNEIFTGRTPPTSLKNVFETNKPPSIPLENIKPPSEFNPRVPAALDYLILLLMSYEKSGRPNTAIDVLELLKNVKLQSATTSNFKKYNFEREKVLIKDQEYLLGSPPTAPGNNEKPSRRIIISEYLKTSNGLESGNNPLSYLVKPWSEIKVLINKIMTYVSTY